MPHSSTGVSASKATDVKDLFFWTVEPLTTETVRADPNTSHPQAPRPSPTNSVNSDMFGINALSGASTSSLGGCGELLLQKTGQNLTRVVFSSQLCIASTGKINRSSTLSHKNAQHPTCSSHKGRLTRIAGLGLGILLKEHPPKALQEHAVRPFWTTPRGLFRV